MYHKKFKDKAGNFDIVLIYPDGREQTVSEDQDLYHQWLAEGNLPAEIPYTAPVITDEAIRKIVLHKITLKRDFAFNNGFKHDGKIFDSSPAGRELISGGKRLAEKKHVTNVKIVLRDGTLAQLDAAGIIALSDAFDLYALSVYQTYIKEMEIFAAATRQQLETYNASGAF